MSQGQLHLNKPGGKKRVGLPLARKVRKDGPVEEVFKQRPNYL